MVVFPNAKINIGLQILGKRDDGYHAIETAMFPVPWCDILEIVPADTFSFQQTGITIDSKPGTNLVEKAYELLSEKVSLPDVSIHLHKVIPAGAGLGGGSSDAVFCLKALNEMFECGLTDMDLEKLAAELGSDCPFFVRNKPALSTGRGTELSTLESSNNKFWIEILVPPIHIETSWAYQQSTSRTESIKVDLSGKPGEWNAVNDFEVPIFNTHPEIKSAKDHLLQQGALYASLSGSGSTVFGLFSSPPAGEKIYPGWSGWVSI